MRKSDNMIIFLIMAGVLTLSQCKNPMPEQNNMIKPPDLEKKPKELTMHGHTRIDHYYWLNERDNPEVTDYLKAENEYTKQVLKHTDSLQDKLFEEIKGRIKQTDMSVPYYKNGYWYYTRFEEQQEYPLICRKKGSLEKQEEILMDVPKLAEGHKFYQLGSSKVSPDTKLLAYSEDTVSRRKYTIKFKNLESGNLYSDEIKNTTGAITWANDNKTVFYVRKDDALRPYKVFMHTLGTPAENDKEVFHETDARFNAWVYKSKSGQYIFICSQSSTSSECRFVDADNPGSPFKTILPREKDHEYLVAHFEDHFYIKTNDKAINFKLVKCPVNQTEKKHWTDVIPHRDDVLFEQMEIFRDYLVVDERKNGLTQLRIINWKDQSEHYIPFEEPAYTAGISINPEFDSELLRFSYTSLTTPSSTYDYNMKTHQKTLLKRKEVLGDFDPENYTSERLYAPARDGVKVPISLVYRKGTKTDGNSPLLLYGYGSYGYSIDPYFSPARLSLLDRGFIFAIAHVRGGEELGRKWYEDGKYLKKKNTFYDFIDCAEYLIDQKYTNKEHLYAQGGSAGGLLVGAVINMRPELFNAVIAAVPFVDVVTTMLDESIPLTVGEYEEWGNPNDETYYEYMLSYSPYDNVLEQKYPAILVTAGLHDSQVQYWEPAKWVAKLRDLKTDKRMLLLHTNMEAGHGGASGRFRSLKETALEYAFLLDQERNTK